MSGDIYQSGNNVTLQSYLAVIIGIARYTMQLIED